MSTKYTVKYLFNAIHWNNDSKFIGDKQIAKRRNENFFRVTARELVSLLHSNQVPSANDA